MPAARPAASIGGMKSLLPTLTAAATLLLVGSAHADSIVYIRDGNVWSAAPDGTRAVQLTDGGQWHSPTQADDGTIAAVDGTGKGIAILARDGRPLRTITTTFAKSGNGDTFAPNPVQLALSPDGSKLAYSYAQYSCVQGSTCGTSPQVATLITDTNVTQATPADTYGYNMGVSAPEWVTGNRLIAWGGAGIGGALIDLPGARQGRRPWLSNEPEDVGDGEISRDGTHMVSTYAYGENLRLRFWSLDGDVLTAAAPGYAHPACDSNADPVLSDPSWSPDGTAVAFAEERGVNVFRFTAITRNHCDFVSTTIVVPGGSEPDWGPADPPAARYTAPTPSPQPTPAPPAPMPAAKLTIATATLSTKQLRRGHATVRVTTTQPGRLTARLGRLASGTATAAKAGTVTIRLSRASRRAAKATLTVTLGAVSASRVVRLR